MNSILTGRKEKRTAMMTMMVILHEGHFCIPARISTDYVDSVWNALPGSEVPICLRATFESKNYLCSHPFFSEFVLCFLRRQKCSLVLYEIFEVAWYVAPLHVLIHQSLPACKHQGVLELVWAQQETVLALRLFVWHSKTSQLSAIFMGESPPTWLCQTI